MTVFVTQSDIQLSGPGLIGSDVAESGVRRSKRITIGAGLTLVDGELVNSLDLSGYLPLIGGTLTGDLKFIDATYDIGKSGATRPRDGFFSRKLNVGSGISLVDNTSSAYGYAVLFDGTNSGIENGQGVGLGLILRGNTVTLTSAAIQPLYYTSQDLTLGATDGACLVAGKTSTGALNWSYSAGGLHIANNVFSKTTPSLLAVYNTYTSSTSFERFQVKANAGAAYQIGSAIGSAGGTNRAIEIGHYNSGGTFTSALSIATDGVTRFASSVFFHASANTGIVPQGNTRFLTQCNSTSVLYFDSTLGVFSGNGGEGWCGNLVSCSRTTPTLIPRTNSTTTGIGGDPANGILSLIVSGVERLAVTSTGSVTIPQSVNTSGSPTAFTLTGAAHTTLTTAEVTDGYFNAARTVNFGATGGTIANQRTWRFTAPTFTAAAATTLTTMSTVSISGPPVASTGVTAANAYALNVESGYIKLAGHIFGTSMSVTPQSAFPTIYASNTFNSVGFWCSGDSVGTCCGGGVFMNYAHTNPGATCSFGYNTDLVLGTDTTYAKLRWGTSLYLGYDAAGILAQRNGTNAQTFRIYSTYTSSTSFESLTFAPTTSAINIGLQVGSAGGTNTRNINFGHWDTSGTFITRFTSATSVTQAISDTTCVFRLYGHGAVATGTQLQCYKARGTDRNTKLYPVSGDIFGGLSCYGYDENAANWSTSKGAYIITASGNWTSTANGTQHTWQVTNSADATKTLTTVMTLTTDGSLNPLCGINSSKLIRQNAEVTYTPTGTTQTITLNDGNHQTLNLTSATGTVTVTLTVPTSSSAGTIIVNQHASAAKDLTWAVSSGTVRWMGTEPNWAADAISSDRLVSWRWNGSIMRLVATDVGT